MTTRQRPAPQEALPGMPPLPFAPVDLESRNALARALRPEYVGINPEEYLDITPAMVELASVEHLRPSLVNTGYHDTGVIGYRPQNSQRLLYVAVTPTEFGMFSGNIRTLGERAVKRTEKSRETRRDGGLKSSDLAAAQRSGAHRVESQLDELNKYVSNVLDPYAQKIAFFKEAAKHPGLSRGKEVTMREDLTYLRTFVFGDMFVAIRGVRHWTSEQEMLARKSVDARLFINRDHNQHIGNFQAMLNLAQEWNGHKRAIAAEKIYQITRYIREKQANEAAIE